MKPQWYTLLVSGAGMFFSLMGSAVEAQSGKEAPPIIIRASAHAMHFNDFQVRRNRDRSLEAEVKNKGLDRAFTEWMMRDHPYLFAAGCIKQAGALAKEFKSSTHMSDFDALLAKRSDLRLNAEKFGHNAAFAEWLRTERPDTYRQHFGLDKQNKPISKHKSK